MDYPRLYTLCTTPRLHCATMPIAMNGHRQLLPLKLYDNTTWSGPALHLNDIISTALLRGCRTRNQHDSWTPTFAQTTTPAELATDREYSVDQDYRQT